MLLATSWSEPDSSPFRCRPCLLARHAAVAFACAIPALVMGVASIDVGALPGALGEHPPRRVIAIFSFLIAALLTLARLGGIVSRTLAGTFGWPRGDDAQSPKSATGVTFRPTRSGRAAPVSYPARALFKYAAGARNPNLGGYADG
jgi:hypothetical protein